MLSALVYSARAVRWGMYGVSTGEWGAGGSAPSRRVITEMEMGFIELQQRAVTSAERL